MRAILTVLLLTATPLMAAPSGGSYSTSAPATGEITAATGLIEAGREAQAVEVLTQVLAKRPDNADALNLMGYAHRRMGDFEQSRVFYTRALAADPMHDGALAYMGVLELEEGNTAAARALLVRLSAVCPTGCSALDDLMEAFSERGVALTS
ncbi:MAG: tetratricopeptide repeat protein [Pseudomonadota bacterium]